MSSRHAWSATSTRNQNQLHRLWFSFRCFFLIWILYFVWMYTYMSFPKNLLCSGIQKAAMWVANMPCSYYSLLQPGPLPLQSHFVVTAAVQTWPWQQHLSIVCSCCNSRRKWTMKVAGNMSAYRKIVCVRSTMHTDGCSNVVQHCLKDLRTCSWDWLWNQHLHNTNCYKLLR